MKDADVVRIARKIDLLGSRITDLISEIGESDHPNAETLYEDLIDQCWFAAWARHVVRHNLAEPEKWETGDYGIRRKRAEKASEQ